MRGILRIIFLGLVVAVVVVIIIMTFRKNPSRDQVMEQLVNDVSLEKMQKDVAAQVAVHKKYIYELQRLNTQIKALGDRLESKIDVAKGFGEIGDEYIKKQFLPLALANYSMGLEIFPQDPILNYKQGLVLANMGSYDPSNREKLFGEAGALYKKALLLDPGYSDPHYSLALLYLISHEDGVNLGSLPEAMTEIGKYIAKDSGNVQSYFLKARIAYAQGDNVLAAQTYQTILNLTPMGSDSYKQAKDNMAQLGIS